jgi:hypothetical protein
VGHFSAQQNGIPIYQVFASRCTQLIQIVRCREHVFNQSFLALTDWKKKHCQVTRLQGCKFKKTVAMFVEQRFCQVAKQTLQETNETIAHTQGCSKRFELKSMMFVAHLFA